MTEPVPNGRPNPILDLVVASLRTDGGEPFSLSDTGLASIANHFDSLLTSPDLLTTTRQLVDFALFLINERGSSAAALALLDIAAKAVPHLKRVSAAAAQDTAHLVETAAAKAKAFQKKMTVGAGAASGLPTDY